MTHEYDEASSADGAAPPLQEEEGRPIVELRGVSRSYGDVTANDSVDLAVVPGRVHAVLGQNGAGKSTLMNILAGVIQPDSGRIMVDGVSTNFRDAGDAFAAGIGMVHQHFQLVPSMTVAENVLLNDEPRRRGLVDRQRANEMTAEALATLGTTTDPADLVSTLSVAARQRVEIARVLRRNVRVLVLDEPTAVLAPSEAADLMGLVRRMADSGTAVVLISHKLDEVLQVADHLTILRAGRVVADQAASGLDAHALANLMVGREVAMTRNDEAPRAVGAAVMSLSAISTTPGDSGPALHGISLELLAGEVHGIAGVDGNGQKDLVSVITGSTVPTQGTVSWLGDELASHSVRGRIDLGVAYIPEDRHSHGLFLEEDITTNLVMRQFQALPVSRAGILRRTAMKENAQRRIAEFEIKGSGDQRSRELSGGNQQKVVLARELSGDARLVVAEQPTRGVDIASAQFIYQQLLKQRDDGKSVLVVSVDLDELLTLADRISVIYGGRIMGTWRRDDFDVSALAAAMTGAGTAGPTTGEGVS